MSANRNLHQARHAKQDDYFTQLVDIEKEMTLYRKHFRDQVIFCNCDDPESSNFWQYFALNFDYLKLKKLISTHYIPNGSSYQLTLEPVIHPTGERELVLTQTPLEGNGDFRSDDCVALLETADIVITNPPFSLFREFVAQLMAYEKKFIILGNMNAITYQDFFPLIQSERLWLGRHNGSMKFQVPSEYAFDYQDETGACFKSLGNICWYTNLDYDKRYEKLILFKKYNSVDYPTYDNYDAINVNAVKDIPADYTGVMGVPISFLTKHNPSQFDILGMANSKKELVGIPLLGDTVCPSVNGTNKYARLFIQRRR